MRCGAAINGKLQSCGCSWSEMSECYQPVSVTGQLYKSIVRPYLEYRNLVWGLFNRTDQKAVERVQKRATRLIN